MNPDFYNQSALVLDNGTFFLGTSIGSESEAFGEICFNTGMTGYQETITDPSYTSQIIVFTFPHVGNVGCNDQDLESITKTGTSGIILRETPTSDSNWRASQTLDSFLKTKSIAGISGIDTRKLTSEIRKKNISHCAIIKILTPNCIKIAHEKLKSMSDTGELANLASCKTPYTFYHDNKNTKTIVVIDYGCKENILRHLQNRNCNVVVAPYNATFEDISKYAPNGILLSNGPGDPRQTLQFTKNTILSILQNQIPLFGICLGHQLLALSLNLSVTKIPQGHRGINHPVKNYTTGTVEITPQNHGFAVMESNIPSHIQITHRSLFDNVIEGIAVKPDSQITIEGKTITIKYATSVQYHPESSSGPHDSEYLFDQFIANLN